MEDNKEEFNNELDPEIIKIRDQIINKIGNKPLEEINIIIKKLLREQMDEVTRLGALAARVKIIRAKITELYETKNIEKKKPQKISKEVEAPKQEEKTEDWLRIKMLESAEVNGKQVDLGVVLDVKLEEAKKLITQKKAEEVKAEDKEIKTKKEEKAEKEVKAEDSKTDLEKPKEFETKELKQKKENKVEPKKEEEKKEIQLEESKDKKEDKKEELIKIEAKDKEEQKEEKVATEETLKKVDKQKETEETKKKIDLSEDLLKVHEETVKKEEKPKETKPEEKKESVDLSEDLLKVHEEKVQKK